ncbi:MAG: hypothetical protein MK193_05400 [Lentisphaeria bacterium]|nr:hypothetical protein [Lentisphaeria bacterium]
MIELKAKGNTLVKTLKAEFKEKYKVSLRVYHGVNFAADDETLANIRQEKKGDDIHILGGLTVAEAEAAFLDQIGVKVQVENKFGELADDSKKLSHLRDATQKGIVVDGRKSLATIQKEFSKHFPKLGLYFFTPEEYQKGQANLEDIEPLDSSLTVGEVRTLKNLENLSINGNLHIKNLEKNFLDHYGLYAILANSDNEGEKYYVGHEHDEKSLTELNKLYVEQNIEDYNYDYE